MNSYMITAAVLSVFCNAEIHLNLTNYKEPNAHFHRSDISRDFLRSRRNDENKISCNGIECLDGRCVSEAWMCKDRNTDDSDSVNKSILWKEGSIMVHYAFAGCGILVLVVLILSCLCSVQEIEIENQCDVKYKAPTNINTYKTTTSRTRKIPDSNSDYSSANTLKKSDSEIQYSWEDEQEIYNAKADPDVKLIKV